MVSERGYCLPIEYYEYISWKVQLWSWGSSFIRIKLLPLFYKNVWLKKRNEVVWISVVFFSKTSDVYLSMCFSGWPLLVSSECYLYNYHSAMVINHDVWIEYQLKSHNYICYFIDTDSPSNKVILMSAILLYVLMQKFLSCLYLFNFNPISFWENFLFVIVNLWSRAIHKWRHASRGRGMIFCYDRY